MVPPNILWYNVVQKTIDYHLYKHIRWYVLPFLFRRREELYCQQAREFGDTVLHNDRTYGTLFADANVDSITIRGTHCIVGFKNDDSPIRFDIYLDVKTGTPEQISIS